MQRAVRSVAVYHYLFLITGAATVLLPILLARGSWLTAADVRSGTLIATQFCGQIVGALLVAKRPTRSLSFGLALVIVAACALTFLARPNQALLFILGIGLGTVMSSVNVAAGQEAGPGRRASVLELVNVFWPVGAALSAPAETWLGSITNPWHMYGLLAALFFPGLVWLTFTRPALLEAPAPADTDGSTVHWAMLAILAFAAALAIAAETGVSAWLPTLAMRSGASARLVAATVAGFWCGSVASRAAAAYLLRHAALRRVCLIAAAGAAVFTASIAFCRLPGLLFALAVLAACCIGPLYPALLTQCVHLRGKGIVFVGAGIGSAAAPWIVGAASSRLGSLRVAMLVPAVGALALLLTLWKANIFPPQPIGKPTVPEFEDLQHHS